ncbi:MAG: hypothetical protein QM811_19595 [Pirellulales bacterium]
MGISPLTARDARRVDLLRTPCAAIIVRVGRNSVAAAMVNVVLKRNAAIIAVMDRMRVATRDIAARNAPKHADRNSCARSWASRAEYA